MPSIAPAPSTGLRTLDAAIAEAYAAGSGAPMPTRNWAAGLRPRHDAFGRIIPEISDDERRARRAAIEGTAACWETQAGQVEAARVEVGSAA